MRVLAGVRSKREAVGYGRRPERAIGRKYRPDQLRVPRGHRAVRAVLALAPQVAGVAFVRTRPGLPAADR